MIKSNGEALPPRSDAPPSAPDRPSAEPRKMLSEREVLEIIPVSRAIFSEWKSAARFHGRPTSRRIGEFGLPTKCELAKFG